MKTIADHVDGYTYGAAWVATSPVPMKESTELKISVGLTAEDEQYLRLPGEVLAHQTRQIVHHWRDSIIASIPNLARHSRSPEHEPLHEYKAKSNLRFKQWILATCLCPYHQEWFNYQQELHCATRDSTKLGRRANRCSVEQTASTEGALPKQTEWGAVRKASEPQDR